MDRLNHINPFARRDSHSANSVITYKVLTLFTWLLSVISTTYYYHRRPYDDLLHDTIPDINYGISTPFRLFIGLVAIYWLVLYILQLVYMSHLFSTKVESVNAACAVGSHFIVYNLFHFAFVMLFVRHHFFLAELMLVINFFNLTFLYFRHNDYPRFIHLPAVSGPLAWTFVALYWDGAIIFAPHSGHLVGRIFAYIFVWSFLGYGLFFLAIYKDYTMGFCMGVLSLALAIGQQYRSHFYFQSFFAFAIMGVLLLYSSVLALYAWSGREAPWWRRGNDSERAPLLAEP